MRWPAHALTAFHPAQKRCATRTGSRKAGGLLLDSIKSEMTKVVNVVPHQVGMTREVKMGPGSRPG
jgi:hypothetical protein